MAAEGINWRWMETSPGPGERNTKINKNCNPINSPFNMVENFFSSLCGGDDAGSFMLRKFPACLKRKLLISGIFLNFYFLDFLSFAIL
jgi:hypothetical protein